MRNHTSPLIIQSDYIDSHGRVHLPRDPVLPRILAFAVAALLMLAVLAFGTTEMWAITGLEWSAAILFLCWLTAQVLSGEIVVSPHPLYGPVAALIAVGVLQLLLGRTAYAYDTVAELLQFVAYLALAFVLLQCTRSDHDVERLMVVFSWFGFVVAVFAILQDVSSSGKLYWVFQPKHGGWVFGPYVNRNHYAGLMEMLTPAALAMAAASYRPLPQRLLFLFMGALMGTSIFLSQSRAGMVVFVIQAILLAAYLLRRKSRPRTIASVVVASFVLGSFICWLGGMQVFARFGESQDYSRAAVLRDSLSMLRVHPFLGWGMGSFPIVYPHFRSFYTNFFVNQAHDDILQLLLEGGLIGFSCGVWFVILLYRNAIRKLRNSHSLPANLSTVAALLGCTGILLHSFVDFNLHIPANAAWFLTLCAIAAAPAYQNSRGVTHCSSREEFVE